MFDAYALNGLNGYWGYFDMLPNVSTVGGQEYDALVSLLVPAGDVNMDGTVDYADFQTLAANYGQTGAYWEQGDFNDDGIVNWQDLNMLRQNINPARFTLQQFANQAVFGPGTVASSTSLEYDGYGVTYASSLPFAASSGTVKRNLNSQGQTINLNGATYSEGLGVLANSSISIALNGNQSRFESTIGVDGSSDTGSSVVFDVYGDNTLLYQSPTNVLSVGGTALTVDAGNNWSSEVGWSGSGGGPSGYESQPSYQTGVVTQTSSARATPDVAYDASPSTGVSVYDSIPYNGQILDWVVVGGTSAGAPQWSALLAIADQGRALSGQSALDSTNPQEVMNILYSNPTDFHDITSGTSTGNPQYSAGPGYDYVTGMGTPIANLVVGSLVGTPAAPHDTLALTTASTTETAGQSFNLTVTAQQPGGGTDTGYVGTVHFTSSDVQAGLPADFTFAASDDGTYTFAVTLKTAGSQSITATDTATPAINGTLSGISVSPAAASQLVLSGLSSTATAGAALNFTVTAEDPYGNVATDYTGTVQFTSSDTAASLPANYTFTNANQGVQTFTLTFETPGT
jgi:NPCBM/NEW2 domain